MIAVFCLTWTLVLLLTVGRRRDGGMGRRWINRIRGRGQVVCAFGLGGRSTLFSERASERP